MNKELINKFVTIHPLITSEDNSFFYKYDNKYKTYETNINIEHIIEITSPILDDWYIKLSGDCYTTNELSIFKIYLVDNRTLYLFGDEFEKFKNLMNNE